MPLSKHFGGKGAKVMASMKKTYPTAEKAEEVFYATENKSKGKKKAKKKSNPHPRGKGGMAVGMKGY